MYKVNVYPRGRMLYISYFQNNKLIRESTGLTNNRENRSIVDRIAKDKKIELMQNKELLKTYSYRELKFSKTSEIFLKNKDIKQSSKNVYESSFDHFTRIIGDKKIAEITNTDIVQFKNHLLLEKAHNTTRTYLNHIRMFFNYLHKEGFIQKPPEIKKLNELQNKIITISDKHFDIILEYLKSRNINQYNLIYFLKETGFRKNEALSLRYDDIDFTNKIIYVKNEKEGRIDLYPLSEKVEKHLISIKELNDKSIISAFRANKKYFNYSPNGVRFFERAMDKLNLNYSIHDIRRTFATKLADTGVSGYNLMKLMRHKDLRTSSKYYINPNLKSLRNILNITE